MKEALIKVFFLSNRRVLEYLMKVSTHLLSLASSSSPEEDPKIKELKGSILKKGTGIDYDRYAL